MLTHAASLLLLLLPQSSEPPHAGGEESKAGAPQDLTELSLEDLMNVEVEVVSAARHAQSLSSAPAAIFVLTSAELRRSGATSIPEALRLVPGVNVARLDSNRWAVTIRGFNSQFANKLLVLVDGRSVYTPLFSGVWWDTLDVPMADIERIEVVRGPGGALWGANAVNGIINIITKPASETLGNQLSLLIGNEDKFIGYVRHGETTEQGAWRAWA
ncbi:MAG: Plug domain-containing protein [Planctomycetes bacterium]|nr:Plug domain-containing protein [Planctomycetota bacterium]